eukprot:CAMPEP_0171062088 /NCGR_PEP_ID=MMETSP0766_2-20121228/4858_1 /TAXON_ID=439317 /ORGANISM="Gambierdiscus australes, Strain CAWD 149" /LENGTH=532 /DNA_ID=CAMNT_0011517861 /DNA_START=5 /DNA_END=1603 /DNA_ORIENTATION=-
MTSQVTPVQFPHCSFEACNGRSSIAPLIDGVPTFKRLEELVSLATSRFDVALSFVDVRKWRHPGTGETFTQWMNRVHDRGIHVHVLCWRLEFRNPVLCHGPGGAGWDAWADASTLDGAKFSLRFDSSGPDHRHCHHEKTWVVDGDTPKPIAVTGGITVTPKNAVATPGHPLAELSHGQRNHDVNVEVRGKAASHIAQHFVQRWNAACGHERPGWHFPDLVRACDLPEPPPSLPHPDGISCQVLRTLRPQQLPDRVQGEDSIRRQWCNAISGAQHTIYIEQQHVCHPDLLTELLRACDRGVCVVYLVPSVVVQERLRALPRWCCDFVSACLGTPVCSWILHCLQWLQWSLLPLPPTNTLAGSTMPPTSYKSSFLDLLPTLAQHENFCLAGLHDLDLTGRASSVYVHSKLIIVDDEFLLVGSANLVDMSMDLDHTELAVAAWGARPAKVMRNALFAEHAGESIPSECLDNNVSAMKWLQDVARQNKAQFPSGRLKGRICELDGRLVGNGCFALSIVFDMMARHSKGKPLVFTQL